MAELDDLVEGAGGGPQQQAQTAIVGSIDKDPEAASRAYGISAEIGVPPQTVYEDLKGFEQEVRERKARRDLAQAPAVTNFLANNPAAAPIAQDDIIALQNFSDQIQNTESFKPPESFLTGIAQGWKHHEYANNAAAYQLGEASDTSLKAYEEDKARLAELYGPDYFLNALGNLLGTTAGSLTASVPTAVLGAGAGLATGGPAGAAAGAVGGAVYGFIADIVYTGAGETYRSLDLVRDRNGNPLPEATKQTAAVAAGFVMGAIARVAPEQMIAPLRGLIGEALTNAIVNPSVSSAIGRAGLTLARAGIVGGAINTAFQWASTIPQEMAKFFSGQPIENILNNPEARQRFMEQTTQAFVDGAMLFSFMAVPGVAVHPIIDAARKGQAQLDATQIDRAMAAADETRMKTRSPDLLEAMVREVNRGDVAIPVEKVLEVQAKQPGAFSYVWNLENQVKHAEETGGDVIIPAAQYFTRTPPEVHELVKDDIRANQEGLTLNEVKDHDENPPDYKPTEINVKGEAQPETVPANLPKLGETAGTLAASQIAVRRQALFLNGLFKDQQAAGMTLPEFTRYSKMLQDVQDQMMQKVSNIAEREARRRQGTEWKARSGEMREQVKTDFADRRDLRVDKAFRDGNRGELGKLRLDPKEVDALMNDASYSDSFLNKRILATKDTVHPDVVAELMGYNSGIGMLHDLRQLIEDRERRSEQPARQTARLVEEETQRRMEERYGKLQDNIQREALDAVLNATQLDVMAEEVKALSAQAGLPEPPLRREDLLRANADRFGNMTLPLALKVAGFERLVGERGRQAELALVKGDFVEAFRHKQRQLMATMLLREAKDFQAEAQRTDSLIRRYQENAAIGSRDPGYTAQIHNLLSQYGFPLTRNPAELANTIQGKSLDAFYIEQTGQGRIIVDPGLLAPTNRPIDRWSVNEFRTFADVLQSLDHNSRNEQIITRLEGNLELQSTLTQIKDNLAVHGTRFDPGDNSILSKVKMVGRAWDAINIKIERLFDWIDQRDPGGILNQAVLRPLFNGKQKKDDMLRDIGEMLKEAGKNLQTRRMGDAVENSLLLDTTGRPMKMTRETAVSIALNVGNRSNLDKLTHGYDWNKDTVMAFLNRTLTENEWKYVQSIWDLFDKYWGPRDEVVRRTSGVGMDPIEAERFKTPFGWTKGGYYPIVYDPLRTQIEPPSVNELFNGNPYFAPLPARGSTKARIDEIAKPLLLDFSSIPNRINEMVHDIAYREPLINAHKVLLRSEFRSWLRDSWGPEYADQMLPWLRNIASGTHIDDRGLQFANNMLREGRMNAQVLLIGFNPVTSLVHGGSALFNSIFETLRTAGIPTIGNAIWDSIKNPIEMKANWDWALAQSGELRNRIHNMDRDIGAFMDQHVDDTSIRTKFSIYSMWLISKMDQLSAVPTWSIAYRHYIEQGLSEEEAVFASDKIVRNAHGSSGLVDTARLLSQDRDEALKWLTMFMGYFNHVYNQVRDIGRVVPEGVEAIKAGDIGTGGRRFGLVAAGSMAYVLAPALWHAYQRPEPGASQESWGHWLASALGQQLAGTTPIVREMAYAMHSGRGTSTPMVGFLDTFVNSYKDLVTADSSKRNWVQHTVALPGAAFGMSTNQLGRAAQFLWDIQHGRQYTDGAVSWYNGLVYGKSHPKR